MDEIKNFGRIPEIEKSEAQVNAEKRANEIVDPYIKDGIEIVNALIKEVEETKLASRFIDSSNTEKVGAVRQDYTISTTSEVKKDQLRRNMENIRMSLIILSGKLKESIVDLEASKIEYDRKES